MDGRLNGINSLCYLPQLQGKPRILFWFNWNWGQHGFNVHIVSSSLLFVCLFTIFRGGQQNATKERKWKNFVEKYCVENVTILPIYWHVILMLLVLCPLIVMIICYSAIFWKVNTITLLRYVFVSSNKLKFPFCSWIDTSKKCWSAKIRLPFRIKRKSHECYSFLWPYSYCCTFHLRC